MATKYQMRVSGSLLDRIEIHVEILHVDYEKLSSNHLGEPAVLIRERVQAARERQQVRFEELDIFCNSDIGDQDAE